jgi:hypothetical protein
MEEQLSAAFHHHYNEFGPEYFQHVRRKLERIARDR